ncbi:Proline dehydrogenase 2 [Abeliophyllum distichum]|uniref:Proline dehydrogenase n=1 Tax=Abeliophyllum distichum TaxID=126358 RepID=A0ABD1SGT7_9LAMI
MANRSVYSKLLHNRPCFFRCLSSATSSSVASPSPVNFAEKSEPTTTDKPIINFDDFKVLFSSVPTSKLIKSSINLHMAAIEPIVDTGMWVMNSRLMETPVLREIILGVVKNTVYEHFCAGKDLKEVARTVTKLCDQGIKAILDYGLEHVNDNESCDRNFNEFIQTIESTKFLPPSSVSFVVVKITAICTPSLLRRVSDLLRWEYKDKSLHLPWKLRTFPILSDSSPFYHTPNRPEPLTPEEENYLHLGHQRLINICEKCVEMNVPLLIDAEDTALQPAIDYFCYTASIMYHKDDEPIVFGTTQAYLKDAKERLFNVKKAADKMGVPVGFKLVRGAYMSSERQLASSLGVKSPIQDSIQETQRCYNDCAAFMLQEIANGSGSVVLATHNVESGKLAASKAIDLGIAKDNQNLQFAQLYGMADALSFGLGNAGFRVSKYLPFGHVEQIIPYLLRRAEENRGLLSTSSLDRHLMKKELMRRLTSSIS